MVREVDAFLSKQTSLLSALQGAAVGLGSSSALSSALSDAGLETAAPAVLSSRSLTRSEHPLLVVLRSAPIADIAFAILRMGFVPGSNSSFGSLLHTAGRFSFASHGQVALSAPVGKLQEELHKCPHQCATADWNRSHRLLVAAISQAGHLHLELPSGGRTLSLSALTRAHADAPSHPFSADAMKTLVAELTVFSRAKDVHSHTLAAALQVPGGPSFELAPPSEPPDLDVSSAYRVCSNTTWCKSHEWRGLSIPDSWMVCNNRACLAVKGDAWDCSKCHLLSSNKGPPYRHHNQGCPGARATKPTGAADEDARAVPQAPLAQVPRILPSDSELEGSPV